MSAETLSATTPRPIDLPKVDARATPHPAILGLASGVLLWFSFPPAGWSWLGWVALVPLFLLIPSRRSPAAIYLGAWLGGLAFWLLALNWILCIDPQAALGWVAMALVLSLVWPAFLAIARVGVLRLGLPVMIAAPLVWVATEYVRAYMFTGFPWYYLAHSQYRQVALIQVADFAGSLGLSLLMASTTACVVDVMTLPFYHPTPRGPKPSRGIVIRLAVLGLSLAAMAGYGAYRIGTARFTEGPRVALLQSNLMQRYKTSMTADEILRNYRDLVRKGGEQGPKPDLFVWPETSFPYGYVSIAPGIEPAAMLDQVRQIDPAWTVPEWVARREEIDGLLHAWVDQMKTPMMVGVLLYDHTPAGLRRFNSAMLFEPGKSTTQSYRKLHLVPFGEYVPLLKTFPWLTALTPYRDGHVPGLAFGEAPSWFDEGKSRYATAICFEDTVPQVTRRLFAEIPDGRSPDILLNLSNDGWFTTRDEAGKVHASSEQEMHLAASVFRAVEHRVPLARAANTGISAIIDGNGRVVASLPAAEEGVLVAEVPLDPRAGLYTILGDWVGLGCLAVTIGLVPLAILRKRSPIRRVAASSPA